MEWDRRHFGIAVKYEPKAVHIKVEPVLVEFLKRPDKGALLLAQRILATYAAQFHTPLLISEDSLAIEILGHTYLDVILEAIERLELHEPFDNMVSKLKASTEVIDCGERDNDSNRFVWDGLVPFADVIYAVLGDRA